MTTQNQDANDVFAVYTKSFDKIQGAVEKTNPEFLQAFIGLQQDALDTWSILAHSVINYQQEFTEKLCGSVTAPNATVSVAQETTEGIIKTIDVNSKIVQTAIDATRQNIKTINEHTSAFAELNQNIFNSWINVFKTQN